MDKLGKLSLNFGSAVLPPPITSKKKQRDSADLTNSFNGLGLDENSALLGSLQSINIGQKKHLSEDKLEESKKLDEIVRLLRKYGTEGFPERIVGRKGHYGEGELNIFAEWLERMGYGNTGHRIERETKLEFNIRYLAHEVNKGVSLEKLIDDMYPFREIDQDYEKFRQDVITALYNTLTGEQAGDFGGRKKKTKKSKKSKKNKKSCKARKSRRRNRKYKVNLI